MSLALALAATVPWVLLPPIAMFRVARSRSLDNVSATTPARPPLVSVILPARNEARNIERCVRSLLETRYPAVEVIVVDDHSSDDTARLARDAGAGDPRLHVIDNPSLPSGWFGKQWACTTGVATARGELLLFTDADTEHDPDLLPRTVNVLMEDGADLVSVVGRQEMRSFWERLLQPQVFWMLLARYGGTESVSQARRAEDVIANGQYLLMRRGAYEAVGGHESVRDLVAEDLALAQRFHRAGFRVRLIRADAQLSTHMYASLAELIAGWGKNVYAGGIHAMPGGSVGRLLFPIVLPLVPLLTLLPVLALVLALPGALPLGWLLWASICVAVNLVYWILIYRGFQQSPWYAFLYPLGAAMVLYIIVRAIGRGRNVGWKGRQYVAR
jgi:chlorobactene glucosyltransferase